VPYYYRIQNFSDENKQWTIDNLFALRRQLDKEIPSKDAEDNLLLATWNIRELGKRAPKHGARLSDSFYYLAEIIARFDFVAVQEVNELADWERVMTILGSSWDYIATDVTDAELGGNGERLTFVYDRRKVRFRNIAGEIVLPKDMLISRVEIEASEKEKESRLVDGKQLRRSPFIASFQSAWFRFDICTVHIYYGADSGAKLKERIEEIQQVARYLSKRADEALEDGKALILLGDFNIVHPEHKTMQALTGEGFVVPRALRLSSNIDRTKYYDQIAFKCSPDVLDYVEKQSDNPLLRNAGVFDIFKSVYTPEQFEHYAEFARKTSEGKQTQGDAELRDYYVDSWRTFQLSDHHLMWVRLKTNDSQAYLERLRARQRVVPDAPTPATEQ
jgi:endonuclease/exonuclease/phosphatase family metal-dependent hydrolase